MQDESIPVGLCQCGCGRTTNLVTQTDPRRGIKKGEHRRYVVGHGARDATRLVNPWIVDPKTGCWVWQAARIWSGYGKWGGRGAHRVVYEHHRGPIPDGMDLDHLCRNRACVNPDHLEPVTRAENIRRSAQTRLTSDDVAAIRRLRGTLSQRQIADRFGVGQDHISRILSGKRWGG